jgi:hypothetical protein
LSHDNLPQLLQVSRPRKLRLSHDNRPQVLEALEQHTALLVQVMAAQAVQASPAT